MNEQTQLESEAPAPAPAPPSPFSVLRILSTSLRVTKHNFVPFLVLAAVLEVPAILLQFGRGLEDLLLSTLVGTITGALMQAVVVYGVVMELQGVRPSTGTCIRTGFAQLGRVIGVTIVSTLAMAGATLLLVVPGIIVFLMLYVTVPVTVVEGLGIRAALTRSRELTHGHKGDLFLIFIIVAVTAIPVHLIAGELGTEAAVVWRTLTSALLGMFFAVTVGVAYVELRKLRDGLHIPDLASAFARFRK
jgi:hypothetical protein